MKNNFKVTIAETEELASEFQAVEDLVKVKLLKAKFLFQKAKMALRFILATLSTIFISCQRETRIKLDERAENTRETLLSHIPIGSNDMFAKKL